MNLLHLDLDLELLRCGIIILINDSILCVLQNLHKIGMASRMLWWLVAASAWWACVDGQRLVATLPGCKLYYDGTKLIVIEPEQTNSNITVLILHNCNDTVNIVPLLIKNRNVAFLSVENTRLVKSTSFSFFCNLKQVNFDNTSAIEDDLTWLRNCQGLEFIFLENTNLSNAPNNLLEGSNKIKNMHLYSCHLENIPLFVTNQGFRDMQRLYMGANEISSIQNPDTFRNADKLIKLQLSENRIEYLHPKLFKPLKRVQVIRLGSNRMKYFPKTLFQNLALLEYVDLSNNLIDYVPENAFLGTNLNTLYLEGNKLKHLPQDFFFNLQNSGIKLKIFFFHDNPWECTCLNKILVKIKKLQISYDSDEFDGKKQACVVNKPRIIVDYNYCT